MINSLQQLRETIECVTICLCVNANECLSELARPAQGKYPCGSAYRTYKTAMNEKQIKKPFIITNTAKILFAILGCYETE